MSVSSEQPPRVKLIPVKVTWQCPGCRNVNPVMAHRLAEHTDVTDVCQVCKLLVILGAVRADTHETVESALVKLRERYPDAPRAVEIGMIDREPYEPIRSVRIQVASSKSTGEDGGIFTAPTLSEALSAALGESNA